jgi:hypothetical protein
VPTEDDTGLQFERAPLMSVEAGADETGELLCWAVPRCGAAALGIRV